MIKEAISYKRICIGCTVCFVTFDQKKVYCSRACGATARRKLINEQRREATKNLKIGRGKKKQILADDASDWMDYSGYC